MRVAVVLFIANRSNRRIMQNFRGTTAKLCANRIFGSIPLRSRLDRPSMSVPMNASKDFRLLCNVDMCMLIGPDIWIKIEF